MAGFGPIAAAGRHAAQAVPPRRIASMASRQILWASAGAGGAVGLAHNLHQRASARQPDGTSIGYTDKQELRYLVSGRTGLTTLAPLMGALICIGAIYPKGRVLLPEGMPLNRQLSKALKAIGVVMEPGEGAKTKSLYAFLGGTTLGSMAAEGIVFGDYGPRTPLR